ncbi:MAG: phage baseplate assembly protein V [Dermatophilaceae bacterium]|nr:phage baseplate assembly protein V [Intrasporangiaceae bacterium]
MWHQGIVTSSQDPQRRNRVRLRVPSLFGPTETGWVEPALDITDISLGERVWAFFIGKDFLVFIPCGIHRIRETFEPTSHRLVVLFDFGTGLEPVTDEDGLWLYGEYPGLEY